MKSANFPIDEELRIADLHSYEILDSGKEKDYEDLIQLVTQITGCPVATISFVDRNRQWFKASLQMCHQETSRDIAFCAHTILQKEVMIINDARTDMRFFDNPLVTGDPNIVFYAGAPIISSNGHVLGSVCAIDNEPRTNFTERQKQALIIIARQVSKLLELRAKNKIIIDSPESQIASEKRNTHLAITENDQIHTRIAYQLHENLAQQLAATKLFIESAEESSDDLSFFLQKAKKTIEQIIIDVKGLSNSIAPTTFQNVNYFAVIEDFAREYGIKNGIEINFDEHESANGIDMNIGLNLFRIIEYQLEISKRCHAKYIGILLKLNDRIDVYISDDGNADNLAGHDNMILYSKMLSRAELIDAQLNRNDTKNCNLLHIKLKNSEGCITEG